MLGPISRSTPHDFAEIACNWSGDNAPAPGNSRSITYLGILVPSCSGEKFYPKHIETQPLLEFGLRPFVAHKHAVRGVRVAGHIDKRDGNRFCASIPFLNQNVGDASCDPALLLG